MEPRLPGSCAGFPAQSAGLRREMTGFSATSAAPPGIGSIATAIPGRTCRLPVARPQLRKSGRFAGLQRNLTVFPENPAGLPDAGSIATAIPGRTCRLPVARPQRRKSGRSAGLRRNLTVFPDTPAGLPDTGSIATAISGRRGRLPVGQALHRNSGLHRWIPSRNDRISGHLHRSPGERLNRHRDLRTAHPPAGRPSSCTGFPAVPLDCGAK